MFVVWRLFLLFSPLFFAQKALMTVQLLLFTSFLEHQYYFSIFEQKMTFLPFFLKDAKNLELDCEVGLNVIHSLVCSPLFFFFFFKIPPLCWTAHKPTVGFELYMSKESAESETPFIY